MYQKGEIMVFKYEDGFLQKKKNEDGCGVGRRH